MRNYISPRDFYDIHQSSSLLNSFESYLIFIIESLSRFGICATPAEVEAITQFTNRLTISVFIVRLHRNYSTPKLYSYLNTFRRLLLYACLLKLRNYKIQNIPKLSSICTASETISFSAPVCPDYSFKQRPDGRFTYTFQNLGGGIGLVARNAIQTLSEIHSITHDLVDSNFSLHSVVYLGDFEANPANFSRLQISKDQFIKQLLSSKDVISQSSSFIQCKFFTDLCNGIHGWLSISQMVRAYFKLPLLIKLLQFSSPLIIVPILNHD